MLFGNRSPLLSGLILQDAFSSYAPELHPFTYYSNSKQHRPSPSFLTIHAEFRNINRISICLAFRLRIRYRLTLPRLTLDRNPWSFGVRAFHAHYRYSRQHSHFRTLQQTSRSAFSARRTLPYQLIA